MLPYSIETAILNRDISYFRNLIKHKQFHTLFPNKLHRHDINNLIHLLFLNSETKTFDQSFMNGLWKVLKLYLTNNGNSSVSLNDLIPAGMLKLTRTHQHSIDSPKLAHLIHSLLINFCLNATEAESKTAIGSYPVSKNGFTANSFMLANSGSSIPESVWEKLGVKPVSSKGKGRGYGIYMLTKEASRLGVGLTLIQKNHKWKFQVRHLTAVVSQKLQSELAVEIFFQLNRLVRKKNIAFKPSLALFVLHPEKLLRTLQLIDG